jgi:tRNA(fMet)-specific endonuclease VapC
MSFLLDTNIASADMKRPAGLAHRFIQHMGRLSRPSIALAELYAGAYLRPDPAPWLLRIGDLLSDLPVLDFDSRCAEQFGRLRGLLTPKGSPSRRPT